MDYQGTRKIIQKMTLLKVLWLRESGKTGTKLRPCNKPSIAQEKIFLSMNRNYQQMNQVLMNNKYINGSGIKQTKEENTTNSQNYVNQVRAKSYQTVQMNLEATLNLGSLNASHLLHQQMHYKMKMVALRASQILQASTLRSKLRILFWRSHPFQRDKQQSR